MSTRSGRHPVSPVLIAPHSYEVDYDPDLVQVAEVVGLCGEDTGNIRIDGALSKSIERETVLHEIMHAVWHQTYLDKKYEDKQEEAIIWTLAPRLLALFRDNPDLVEYLCEEDE